jgi:hypothetical protein
VLAPASVTLNRFCAVQFLFCLLVYWTSLSSIMKTKVLSYRMS